MVTNEDVVRTLELIADLLEIRGENAFKVRAYRSAAEQVDNLGTPITDIAKLPGGLEQLSGVGPAIAIKVDELIETGKLQFLEDLRREVPESLIEVRHIPGVGPKMAGVLYRERGVQTVDELVVVAKAGGLEGLPRLGDKSIAKIVSALQTAKSGEQS
jgi:DNA polymerase (family 10)